MPPQRNIALTDQRDVLFCDPHPGRSVPSALTTLRVDRDPCGTHFPGRHDLSLERSAYIGAEIKEQQPSHLVLVPLFLEKLHNRIWTSAEEQGARTAAHVDEGKQFSP
jgi:hypothetical protein